ncbi:hypothetical protein C9374_006988 [Naegleria lovaniensis]|uniref:Hemerythrin-like domain-containing protein n=1 Tax=Naegleria lovaniensis TaxID=51637 RepID=A0AA88KRQ4_NAELO|nr:uncharacterized protein C9374_006988 [Naegleria lovaniensis]KAG2393457.1 hypothetical protein C9374_006988 [Naegleria lovaniensis]
MKDERVSVLDIINTFESTKRLSVSGINGMFDTNTMHSHSLFQLHDEEDDDELLKKSPACDSSDEDDDTAADIKRISANITSIVNFSSPTESKSLEEENGKCEKSLFNIADLAFELHNTITDEKQMLETIQKAETLSDHPLDFTKDLLDPKKKCSLLHTAAKLDFLTVMQYLLDKQPCLLESKDRAEATPIFYACSSAHSKSVTMLAINGANLNIHDKYEASPLSVSLNSKNKSKGFSVARVLLGFHVDVEYKVYCGNSILHLACREGDLEKVQFIVEDLKHNIFRRNTKQESCLFRAVRHPHVTKYLLEYCNNHIGHEKLLKLLFMKNDKGQTVIHHICSKGYLESLIHIISILSHDVEKIEQLFNEKDSAYGLTPLHISVLSEQEGTFEFLIRSKEVQLDIQNKIGDTALHIAVRNENLPMIKELYHLYSSKSLQLKNAQKKTIEKLAKERNIDLKKMEKELEQDNAGIQKESFWSSLFGKKKKEKSHRNTMSFSSQSATELQSRMSTVSRRNSLLVAVSWDPQKYAVGYEQIDSQHMQLIEWLKNLSEASLTKQSHWVVGYTIGCLLEYTEFHFEDEELLMMKYRKGIGEDYVKKHLEEHETFTTKIRNMQREYVKNHSTSLDIELLNYLIGWLVKHINFTDRKLADFVNNHPPDEEK